MQPTVSVLTISGHDPTGGAGIQADTEAILSQGCHPCSLITCLTAQDSRNLWQIFPQAPESLCEQMEILLSDISVRAVKIGLLGSDAIARALAGMLQKYRPGIVILDPVLRASGGAEVADRTLIRVLCDSLVPQVTVITPNLHEARLLTGAGTPSLCARKLLERGCQAVLLTGGDEPTPLVYNTLYHAHGRKTFSWERLPQGAHGSGCTLASTLAALLARGLPLEEAASKAQQYTWNTIKHAFRPGRGQPIPWRFFRS